VTATAKTPRPANEQISVVEVISRWAAAIDTKDWAGVRAVFADQFSSSLGEQAPDDPEPPLQDTDTVLASWRQHLGGLDATQHLITNHIVDVAGDHALLRASAVAVHVLRPGDGEQLTYTVGSHYRIRMRRSTRGWRITGFALFPLWTDGPPQVFALDRQQQLGKTTRTSRAEVAPWTTATP